MPMHTLSNQGLLLLSELGRHTIDTRIEQHVSKIRQARGEQAEQGRHAQLQVHDLTDEFYSTYKATGINYWRKAYISSRDLDV